MRPTLNLFAYFAGIFGAAADTTVVRRPEGRSRTRLQATYRRHANLRRKLALQSKRRNWRAR